MRAFLGSYHHVNPVHGSGPGQSPNPAAYQRTPTHRQQRLRKPDQVSEPAAAVGADVPLQPGSVAGGEDHGLHLDQSGSGFWYRRFHQSPTNLGQSLPSSLDLAGGSEGAHRPLLARKSAGNYLN